MCIKDTVKQTNTSRYRVTTIEASKASKVQREFECGLKSRGKARTF